MQRIRSLLLILATVASVTTLAVAPVAADHGSDSGSGDSSTSSTSGGSETETSTPTGTQTTSTENEQEVADQTSETEVKTELASIREHAKQTLETERKNGHEKSLEARQKSCQARQAEINTRINNYATAAQRHLAVFEGLQTKVQNFYTTKKLNVTNYDTLLATAQAKQADAQKAVDALKALDVNIDCTSSDPAQSVAAVKTAVANARVALQAYRTAIKDLIVALKGASTAADNTTTTTTTTETTTGGNQ